GDDVALGQSRQVFAEIPLQGEDSDDHQPRSARRCGCGISSTLMPTMASPRPRDTLASTSGSSWNVVALTIAAARGAGLPDLKMPEPTKTPSAPSCIIMAASAGVAMPPAVNSTTGSLPVWATSLTSSYGACSSLAATYSSSSGSDVSRLISPRIWRMC